MSVISTVKFGFRTITLHEFTGEVMDANSAVVTNYTVDTGVDPEAHPTSMQVYDKIFVRAKNGEECIPTLLNAHLNTRAGHWVSIIIAYIEGSTEREYIAVYNHDTDSLDFSPPTVKEISGPPAYNLLAFIAILMGLGGLIEALNGSIFLFLVLTGLCIGFFIWLVHRRTTLKTAVKSQIAKLKSEFGR